MRIRDSVAFVTGANRGLGLAFAKELLGRGVEKLYAGVRNPDGVDLPGVIPVKFDVTDPAVVAAAAARCKDVTLLINNAGIGRVDASALDPAVIDNAREFFETNFYGIIRASPRRGASPTHCGSMCATRVYRYSPCTSVSWIPT